jgi:uncharacterized protein
MKGMLRELVDRIRLNLMVYVAPSRIHGNGLFANLMIPKGTYLGTYRGKRVEENDTYVLWLADAGGEFGIDGENDLRFANHSLQPNAEMDDQGRLYTLRDIQPGEEITWHYGDEWSNTP